MRIWITGIAGFLGSHIADSLNHMGHNVLGNDNEICHSNNFAHQKIDCRDYNSMNVAFNAYQPDVLIHCAATAHEGLSNFSPSFITKNIYEASVATFSAAIEAKVKRIIFMSSMARYGAQTLPFHEAQTPHPIDPYGIAKVAAEQTLKVLCELHGVEYVILVPHNIIGPRQNYQDPFRNVAAIMINRALLGKPLLIYGDGKQKRCFSPVKDCLHTIVKTIDASIISETINIGPDHGEVTIIELAEMINDLTGGKSEIQHCPARPNEVKNAWCTSSKAERMLDYKPQQSLRSCLGEMVKYITEHGPLPFKYTFPIEITSDCPKIWLEQKI